MKYWKINLAQSKSFDLDIVSYYNMNEDIIEIMRLQKTEIDWDDMYTIKDAKQRFNDGLFCHILFDNDYPIGIRWFYEVRPNLYGFNYFISKSRPDGISHKFFEQSNRTLYNKGYQTLTAYCDDWNDKMWNRVNKTNGFQPISVHMFKDMIGAAKKKTYF